jgi:hypothetical protein
MDLNLNPQDSEKLSQAIYEINEIMDNFNSSKVAVDSSDEEIDKLYDLRFKDYMRLLGAKKQILSLVSLPEGKDREEFKSSLNNSIRYISSTLDLILDISVSKALHPDNGF